MNTLTAVSFACLVLCASSAFVPAGQATLIGASGVVGPNGAVGPSGVVSGYGAVGPNGLSSGIHGHVLAAPGIGFARAGLVSAYDDGQWHGEGLWESQDHARSIYGYGHPGLRYLW